MEQGPAVVVNTRATIVAEATQLFGIRGYAGTSMRDIAGAVGLLPGSLYAHIEGKEQLLLEVVATGIERFLTLKRLADPSSGEPVERFRSFIVGHVALVAEDPQRSRVINHQWRFLSGEQLQLVVEKRRQYEDILKVIVEDGQRSGDFDSSQDIKILLLVVLGALNWTPEWYNPTGPESADEVGHRLADALLRGLQGQSSAQRRSARGPRAIKDRDASAGSAQ